MVPQIFQVHVFRPTEALAASSRRAEQTSFARVLGQAASRAAPADGTSAGASPNAAVPSQRARGSAPWLRSEPQRALAGSIERASSALGVEPALAVAVAIAESSLDPAAQAYDGLSSGTFQVRPSTASDMRRLIGGGSVPSAPGVEDVTLGVTYLRHLDDLFSESTKLRPGLSTIAVPNPSERRQFAVAAFNAGQGRVASAQARAAQLGGDPTVYDDVRPHLPSTTRVYVDRVTRYASPASRPLTSA